jgi:hypothetical protein
MTVSSRDPVEYLVATAPQDTLSTYRITVTSVRDSAGNGISPIANSLAFLPNPSRDTTTFRVEDFSLRDSTGSVEPRPSIELYLSRPARLSVVQGSVTLADSLGRNVPVDLTWRGSVTLAVRPLRALANEGWYVLSVRESGLADIFGAAGRDTTIMRAFQIISSERLGSIEGVVADADTLDTAGPIVVFVQAIEGGGMTHVRRTIPGPGPFVLAEIPEGRYLLGAFRDRNGNGLHDAGSVFPYQPSERYRIGADTLRVRARWPYEGARLELRAGLR